MKNLLYCTEEHIASTIYSYSRIATSDSTFMYLVKENFDKMLMSSNFSLIKPHSFFKLLNSLSNKTSAILNYDDPSIPLYFKYISMNINAFGKEELIGILVSLSEIDFTRNPELNVEYSKIFSLIESRFNACFNLLTINHIANIIWCLGVSGKTQLSLGKRCFKTIFNFSREEIEKSDPIYIRSFLIGVFEFFQSKGSSLSQEEEEKYKIMRRIVFDNINYPMFKNGSFAKQELFTSAIHLNKIFERLEIPYISEFILEDYNVDFYLPGFFDSIFFKGTEKLKENKDNDLDEIFKSNEKNKIKKENQFLASLNTHSDFLEFFEKTKHNSLVIEINGTNHYLSGNELKNSSLFKMKILRKKVLTLIIPSTDLRDISNLTMENKGRIKAFVEYLQKKIEKIRKEGITIDE
jgi:hypothetical protein